MIFTFDKNHLRKLIAISFFFSFTSLITRLSVKLFIKLKQSHLTSLVNQAKEYDTE